jgi:hypothetical protein
VVPLKAFALLSPTATYELIFTLPTMLALMLFTLLSATIAPLAIAAPSLLIRDDAMINSTNNAPGKSLLSFLLCVFDYSNLAVNNKLGRLAYLSALEMTFPVPRGPFGHSNSRVYSLHLLSGRLLSFARALSRLSRKASLFFYKVPSLAIS